MRWSLREEYPEALNFAASIGDLEHTDGKALGDLQGESVVSELPINEEVYDAIECSDSQKPLIRLGEQRFDVKCQYYIYTIRFPLRLSMYQNRPTFLSS